MLTLRYEYGNDGHSRGVGFDAWSQDTTIILPSNARQDVYTNYAGEPMLSALTDIGVTTLNPGCLVGLTWNTSSPTIRRDGCS